jgi:hypothetical protein
VLQKSFLKEGGVNALTDVHCLQAAVRHIILQHEEVHTLAETKPSWCGSEGEGPWQLATASALAVMLSTVATDQALLTVHDAAAASAGKALLLRQTAHSLVVHKPCHMFLPRLQ